MHIIHVDQATEFPDSEHVTSISAALQEVALLDAALTDHFHKQIELPPITIAIAPGTYTECVEVRRANITFEGMGSTAKDTIIQLNRGAYQPAPDGQLWGTMRAYTFGIFADEITLSNLTIKNTCGRGEVAGQGLALFAGGDKCHIINCEIKARQDTLFLGPVPNDDLSAAGFAGEIAYIPRRTCHHYIEHSYIEGDVDFIFGGGRAYFDECTICSLNRDKEPNGYVTAASTSAVEDCGFVFNKCKLISNGAKDDSVYLGRPWRVDAHTAFVNCELGPHVKHVGYFDWNKPEVPTHTRYEAITCTGEGWNHHSSWVSWARSFDSEKDAPSYSKKHVLQDWDV